MLAPPFDVVTPHGSARITLEIYEDDGRLVAGIRGCDLIVTSGGRLLSAARAAMPLIEDLVRMCGVVELRLAGRDWARLLPDYEPLEGVPNGLRKVL